MNNKDSVAVLIVDDRPENLASLEALLDDMEVELVRANSGNEALRQTLYRDFALVLLDVQMPEMDGFETAHLMHLNPATRQLPIIFLTAGLKEECQLDKGYETGAVDYLIKPIDATILRSKVRVFSELYRQRRELEWTRHTLELRNKELQENQQRLEAQHRALEEAYHDLERETAQRLKADEKLRQKEHLLIHQSRLAAMGEMIGNIAHQWRQPLNSLGLLVQELPLIYECEQLTWEQLESSTHKSMQIIQHMSRTIDDFRNFFKPDKEMVRFSVQDQLDKTLSLLAGTLLSEEIAIEVRNGGEAFVYGYPNEFCQVLLNILANAKDALAERGVTSPRVTVTVDSGENRARVTIADNAGGIPEDIITRVFDPYFTTKGPHAGTGVGLFMSKIIIEKNMGGSLTVHNGAEGAEFSIVL